MKKILFLAFTLALALTQAQVSREYPAGFDKWKVIQNARQKGIPEVDMDGYVRAAYARYLQKGNEHTEREYREKLTVVNMNKRQVAQTVLSTQCQNSDFSMLNYANWTGDVSSSCSTGSQYPVPTWLGTGINGTNGSPVHMNTDPCNGTTISTDRQTIMSIPIGALTNNNAQAFTNGYDPSCCNTNTGMYDLTMTPQNGVNSIRLGSAYANYTCEKLVYQMTVNNTNTQFTYRFAVVINDGGHGVGEQPAFLFAMRDSVGNLLAGNANCVSYNIDASGAISDTTYIRNSSSNPCFNSGGSSTYYRKWHTVTVDLTSYINHTVYAEFQTLDCTYSGHFCYAYISANCGALAANVSGFCGGAGSVTMTGPPGFASYQWYGPNNQVPISGATSYSYTATGANNNDVYSVDCITIQGCTTKLNVTVAASNILATAASAPSCHGGNNGSASVSVSGGTQYSYNWSPGGASTSSISSQPAGPYSVTVHDLTGNCPDTTLSVTIGETNAVLQTSTDTMCGTQTTLSAPTTGPYTWYDNNNQLISGSTGQSYTVTNGSGGQHYTVTYHDPTTGCLDSLRTTLSQINISFVPVSSPPATAVTMAASPFRVQAEIHSLIMIGL